MNPAVRIERGYYLIDADAWVDQRVGQRAEEYTGLLCEFTGHDLFREQPIAMDTSSRVVLWCAARGWQVSEGMPLYHDDQRLTRPVDIILATTPEPSRQAVAIVIVEDGDPVVYPDVTTDEGYWYQVATVDIACPTGHLLSWDGGGGLVEHTGTETTIAAVFGTDPYAPFQSCRTCDAYDNGDTDASCDRGGWAVYCPACGSRCSLNLPDIPTSDPMKFAPQSMEEAGDPHG